MALFTAKKTRTTRAATLRAQPSAWNRFADLLRDRSVLLRLLLCALAVLAMLVAVEGWKAPFAYREGDRVEHGIAAKVEFDVLNRLKTEQARSDAEARVPPIFVNDPAPLRELPEKLRLALTEVIKAESLEQLDPDTRAAFGLTVAATGNTDGGPMSDQMYSEFQALKARIGPEGDTAGSRIDDLVQDFERFIEPLIRNGRAAPAVLKTNSIRDDQTIAVVTDPDQPLDEARTVQAAGVQLEKMLEETGRLGSVLPQQFSDLNSIQDYLKSWMLSQTPVTLAYDAAATNRARRAAREAVQPVTDEYNKNDVLVPAGVVLDEDRLALLRAEYEAMQREVDPNQRTARIATVFLMVLVLAVLNGFYIVYYEPKLARSAGRLGLYLAVLVIAVALGRVASLEYRAEIIPLMVTAMILAIAYNQVLATITAFTLTLLITFSTVADLGQFIILMSVSATSIIPLKSVPSRATIVKIGFLAAAVFFLVSVGTGILGSQAISQVWTSTDLLKSSLRGAAYCLVAGYFVAGTLPFIESGFGVVTDISLLEMSDVSHPLLQELVRRAPGTYNHSMTVATIAETAADKIGANGLLVRVGAYYHDVGKMLKPQYFIENVSEGTESGHAHLNPAMSTLVIIGHVKDGVDLARQHNLPQPLIDFIEQHHGTTLVEYFYREAARLAVEQPDHKTDAEESNFRYPGPKPQTREAGVLMLADCVESASRTLSEPTPKRLENLVKSLAMKRLLDGQFDESSLTLSEIRIVEESLIKSLIGIYHGRIKYTVEQRTA